MMRRILWAILGVSLVLPTGAWRPRGGGGGGGSSDVLLSDATVVESTGSTQTSVPISLGVPLASGIVTGSNSLKVVDQDSGLPILCQEDSRASDLTPAVRFTALTCIDPTLTANETKSLKIYTTASAPSTGTDIAVSDITATAYDEPVSVTNINGVSGTWTASPLTALSSGNSGWVNATTPTVPGTSRSGGGLATEYILFVPLTKSGTADAQLRAIFDVTCYKATRAAVSGGNPILSCRTDTIMENSYVQASSPVDDYYGITIGSAGAVLNLPNSTPSIALTLGSVGPAGTVTVTAGSSLFTANSQGQVIANGTGVAVINGYTDATHVTANIYTAFGSTTLGSGTYTLYGTNHPYGERYTSRGWWGPSATPNPPTVDGGGIYLGDAWNNGTLTGGPFAYVASTSLVMNYAVTPTTCGATSLANLNAMGTNPMSYQGGGQQFGAGGTNGNLGLYLEQSGEAPTIGVMTDWDVCGLIRYDANAAAIIFGNAKRWMTFPMAWRDSNTGKVTSPCNVGSPPNCTSTVNYVIDGRFTGTKINQPSATSMVPWSPDGFAHDPEGFYTAYLLTGDYQWLENQQFYALNAWTGNDGGLVTQTPNTAIQKTVYTNAGNYNGSGGQNGYQERGRTWALRTITNAALFTPDTTPSPLGMSKAILKDWLANEWVAPNGGVSLFVNDTGGSGHFATVGPRWTYNNNNGFSSFETGYATFALFHQYEQGMLDTNGVSFLDWFAEDQASKVNDTTDVVPQYTTHVQYFTNANVSASCPGTYVSTWADTYTQTASFGQPGSYSKGLGRTPNTTLSLSSTSGSSITATLGGGGYFAAGAVYVGMWISTTDGGLAKITAVNSSNQVTVSTAASQQFFTSACTSLSGAAFGTTSYTTGQFAIPMPAPGDPIGTDFAQYISSPGDDYMEIIQANTLLMSEYGLTGGSTACPTVWNYTNSSAGCGVQPMSLQQPVKWVISHR